MEAAAAAAAAVVLVAVGCVRFATGALLCLPCWFLTPSALTGLLLTSDSILPVKMPKSGDVQVIQRNWKQTETNERTKKKISRHPVFNLLDS